MMESPVIRNEDGDLVVRIPEAMENMKLPDPGLVSFYYGLEKRHLWIDFEIKDQLLDLGRYIVQWNIEDAGIHKDEREPIIVFINTIGGDLCQTFGFIDLCIASETPVYTVNVGMAMSAGALILIAGSKRYCLSHSRTMIHSGSGATEGTFEQNESAMEYYKGLIRDMSEYIMSRTKIDSKLYKKKKSIDWYIGSNEALLLGVVDHVIESINDIT